MKKTLKFVILVGSLALLVVSFFLFSKRGFVAQYGLTYENAIADSDLSSDFYFDLAKYAEERTEADVVYDGAYYPIAYPMGDVDSHKGVCTDVVIRSYRKLGIDLQELVHVDMNDNFLQYPKLWGLLRTDTNIDHRRVPNLMVFFKRQGATLAISENPSDYEPGHIVAWDLGGGVTHIGIVSTKKSMVSGNPMLVHNIGAGPKLEDMLFDYQIIGHYAYAAKSEVNKKP